MITGCLLLIFAVLLVFGVPIAYALAGASIISLFVMGGDLPGTLVIQRFFSQMNSFSTMAIPLYILAGELMTMSGITEKIVDFAMKCVGHIRGGLAQVCILASMLMAGISGSCGADCAAIGAIMSPAMRREYDDDYAVTILACASTIGPIIPPSILMVIYCSSTGLSIGKMFIGGVIPGIVFGLGLMALSYYYARKRDYKPGKRSTWKERFSALWRAIPALLLPIIIVGTILGGICTATETGAIACAYALIVGLVNGKIKLKDLKELKNVFFRASVNQAAIMAVIGLASISGWVLAYDRAPEMISNFLNSITTNATVFIIICWAFYLFIGLFMEGTSTMIIMTPFMHPIAVSMGIDPIQFGIFTIVVLLIGSCTPPVGTTLYLAARVAGVEAQKVFRLNWRYVSLLSILCLVMAIVPWFTTWLPSLIR